MLPANLRKLTAKGFTLIELLVVIGILGALTIMALVTLNPAEAQKKTRDVQRLKDLATIQSIVESFLNDNPGALTLAPLTDTSAVGASSCSTGWLKAALGKTVCPYANVLPVDPVNRSTTVITQTGTATTTAYYFIKFTSGSYKICTYLESASNRAKLTGDGEAALNDVVAVFSSDAIVCP